MQSQPISAFWKSIRELTPKLSNAERVALLMRVTGVRQASVSRWKTGAAAISNAHALKLAGHFQCDPYWLQTNEINQQTVGERDPRLVRLRQLIDDLTPDDMAELEALAELKSARNRRR